MLCQWKLCHRCLCDWQLCDWQLCDWQLCYGEWYGWYGHGDTEPSRAEYAAADPFALCDRRK